MWGAKAATLLLLLNVALAGRLVEHSLIPELEGVSSLTQLVAAVTTSSTAQATEAYRQLGSSVQSLTNMRSQIHGDQSNDEQLTLGVNTGFAAEEAALFVAVEKARDVVVKQKAYIAHLDVQAAGASKSVQMASFTLTDTQHDIERTATECHGILDHRRARIAAAKNDLDTVTRIEKAVEEIICPTKVPFAIDQKAALSLLAEVEQAVGRVSTDPNRNPAADAAACSKPGGCSTDGASDALLARDITYSCTTRKTAVRSRVADLKAQLYGLASQDTHTFEQTHSLCMKELAILEESASSLADKIVALKADAAGISEGLTTGSQELESLSASQAAAEDMLAATRANSARFECRFKRRSKMRTGQMDLVGKVLYRLQDLSGSSYAETHLQLTSGCSSQCQKHGMCFRGVCHCDDGWKGVNCTSKVGGGKCHFSASSEVCQGDACAPLVSTGTLRSVSASSPCAAVLCQHCRETPLDPGCREPQTALFCAEKERRDGCDAMVCPEVPANACGDKRIVRDTYKGCCFSSILDCEDKCSKVQCPLTPPECPEGLMVRYPLQDCCFNRLVDCVDVCAATECPTTAPSCPAGKSARSTLIGCCFNPELDCEDDCANVACDDVTLPAEACSAIDKRWTGSTSGCCFDVSTDCVSGDTPGQEAERNGLVDLYQSTAGSQWHRKDGWTSDKWICFWHGVECAGPSGSMRVSELKLPSNNMAGTLPAGLFQLTQIRVLDLDSNDLTGPLPSEFERWTQLEILKLRDNALTGVIPNWVTQGSELMIVYLGNNYFTGFESVVADLGNDPDKTFQCENNCVCGVTACEPRNLAPRLGQSCSACATA